jgi:hypothetical protein
MARIVLNIRNQDVPRLRALIEAEYDCGADGIDLSTDELIIEFFQEHLKKLVSSDLMKVERAKKLKETVLNINPVRFE